MAKGGGEKQRERDALHRIMSTGCGYKHKHVPLPPYLFWVTTHSILNNRMALLDIRHILILHTHYIRLHLAWAQGSVVLFVRGYGDSVILIEWLISWILDCCLAPLRIWGIGNQSIF